jgi:hypothetical protein
VNFSKSLSACLAAPLALAFLTVPTSALVLSSHPAALGALVLAQEGVSVTWKGEQLSAVELEETLSEEVSALISGEVMEQLARFSEWVLANEYTVTLSNDARVVLITASKKVSMRRMKLVDETVAVFDQLMSLGEEGDGPAAENGAGSPKSSRPVVLVETEDEGQYRALVSGLASQDPDMERWAASVTGQPGFSEMRIASAVWQSEPVGYEIGEVWRSENELVNRLARLLLHRRYGRQPTWLGVASAWRVEMEVLDTIYCFPYRGGFVGVGDHGGWQTHLKSEFKKRKKSDLRPDEFAAWKPNTWDEEEAHMAWGFVEFLARHKPGVLGAFAAEYRELFEVGYLTTFPDGSWRTNPSFVVSLEEQAALLESLGGEGLFDAASEFFRKGKRYRPARRR